MVWCKDCKDCVTFHRRTAYHFCHSMHAFTGSCEKFSILRYDSWSALPWKHKPGKNRIRTFLKTQVVFFGLLSPLVSSSLAVFAVVQDVVHLVFHVSIKWGVALLVHHFVVRQRLIEPQLLVDFSSVSFNYSVYARSWPTSSPGCFSLALEVRHHTSNPKKGKSTLGRKLDPDIVNLYFYTLRQGFW